MAFSRARGAVFQVQGPETTPFEVGGGEGGANWAVLSLWPFRSFRTVRVLNLSSLGVPSNQLSNL